MKFDQQRRPVAFENSTGASQRETFGALDVRFDEMQSAVDELVDAYRADRLAIVRRALVEPRVRGGRPGRRMAKPAVGVDVRRGRVHDVGPRPESVCGNGLPK